MQQFLEKIKKQAEDMVEEILKQMRSETTIKLSDIQPGQTFMIADHEFIVLEHAAEGTKVISKEFWQEDSIKFGENKDYRTSDIKKYMEEEIQPVIERILGADNLVEHEVSLEALDGGNDFGSIKCKVHPIDFFEARKYFELLVNEGLEDWWWTLTPWDSRNIGYKNSLVVVSPSGDFSNNYFSDYRGVRPFCILKSDILVSLEN